MLSVWNHVAAMPYKPDQSLLRPLANFITFEDPNLNLAAAYIIKFQETKKCSEWFKLTVDQTALRCFEAVMDSDKYTYILQFWCEDENKRHMIVFAPEKHFLEKVWTKVGEGVKSQYRLKYPMDLMRALIMVSQKRTNHTVVNKPLPYHDESRSLEWILSCLWETGLSQILCRKGRKSYPDDLCNHTFQNKDGSWAVMAKDLSFVPIDLIIPVSKHFQPVTDDRETLHYLHLPPTGYLYFDRVNKKETYPDSKQWENMQKTSGNVLGNLVRNLKYTLTGNQQSLIKWMNPVMIQMDKFEKKLSSVQFEIENLKDLKNDDIQKRIDEMGNEIAEFTKIKETMKQDIQSLNSMRNTLTHDMTELKNIKNIWKN